MAAKFLYYYILYFCTDNEQKMPSRSRRSALVGTGVGPLTIAPISPAYQTYLKVLLFKPLQAIYYKFELILETQADNILC